MQGIGDAVRVDEIVELSDTILLMLMWGGSVVLEIERYVHGDVDFGTSMTGIGNKSD